MNNRATSIKDSRPIPSVHGLRAHCANDNGLGMIRSATDGAKHPNRPTDGIDVTR
jgi:hypothetical protein